MAREREDIKRLRFWRGIVAEFVGSMLLVAIGCGTWTSGVKEDGVDERQQLQPSIVKVSLAFGLTYTGVLYCSRSVGDAHVTPGVTVALLLTRRVSFARGALYVTAQLIGAVVGAALAMLVTSSSLRHGNSAPALGCTVPASKVTESQAFSVEFMTSFFFVFVVFACRDRREWLPIATGSDDSNGSSGGRDWAGSSVLAGGPATKDRRRVEENEGIFAIGLVYASLMMFSMPYTGGSFNTARSFGPALVNNVWTSHWIYWFGPLLGAVCGGAIYDVIFSTKSSFSRVRTCLLVFHQSRDSHVIDEEPIVIDQNGTGLDPQQHQQPQQPQQHGQQTRRMSRTHVDRRGRIQTTVMVAKKNDILRGGDDYDFNIDDGIEEDGITTSLVEVGGATKKTVSYDAIKAVRALNESQV